MRNAALLLLLLAFLSSPELTVAEEQPSSGFLFAPGQQVYVVALTPYTQDRRFMATSLEIERKARKEFQKRKKFIVTQQIGTADFVFLILYDSESSETDELALAILPSDYQAKTSDLDALRMSALWQSAEHFHRGRQAAIAAATLGIYQMIRPPSVSRTLVRKFHKEVLPSQ